MKLIVGLGNPEKKYENTRHNTGFVTVDRVADSWQDKPKFHGQLSEVEIGEEKILFYKPTTYYNESGKGVRLVKDFYKIDNSDILVIHDDLALPFGTIRTRVGGSDAGNNGIKSLNTHLGDLPVGGYARIRVGIGQDQRQQDDVDFVLSSFSKIEAKKLPDILEITDTIMQNFILENFETTSYKVD